MTSTCDLCDAHKSSVGPDFQVLPPVFRSFGGREKFSGPAWTVKCFEDNTQVKAALESPGDGRVLVVDGGASLRRALVGGLIGAAAERNGWAGVIVNGCVRDVAELRLCDVGILALGAVPLPTERRGDGLAGERICIQGCWVENGYWVYADEDGVVIASRSLEA